MEVFEINIEFDRSKFHQSIESCCMEGKKGYVSFVDANVLSIARRDEAYLSTLQNSMMISCDGGSIAAMVNRIHGTNVRAYNGPDLFEHYIGQNQYKQVLLGNTEEVFLKIKVKLQARGLPSEHISHIPVPFANVEEFDYLEISDKINTANPDFIWVSLGAPKQEWFMAKMLPYVDKGVMFGIGAAFNFYIGKNVQPRFHIGAFRFIWLDRIFREPKKQLKRVWKIVKAMPVLYIEESKRYKASL